MTNIGPACSGLTGAPTAMTRRRPSARMSPDRSSHKGWFSFWGPRQWLHMACEICVQSAHFYRILPNPSKRRNQSGKEIITGFISLRLRSPCSFGSTRSQVRILSPRLTSQGLARSGCPQNGPQNACGALGPDQVENSELFTTAAQ